MKVNNCRSAEGQGFEPWGTVARPSGFQVKTTLVRLMLAGVAKGCDLRKHRPGGPPVSILW